MTSGIIIGQAPPCGSGTFLHIQGVCKPLRAGLQTSPGGSAAALRFPKSHVKQSRVAGGGELSAGWSFTYIGGVSLLDAARAPSQPSRTTLPCSDLEWRTTRCRMIRESAPVGQVSSYKDAWWERARIHLVQKCGHPWRASDANQLVLATATTTAAAPSSPKVSGKVGTAETAPNGQGTGSESPSSVVGALEKRKRVHVRKREVVQESRDKVGYDIDETPKEFNAFWDYQFLFESQRREVETPIRLEVVHGKMPQDLMGDYYLCGPGIFTDDYGSSINPLDGHGYLRKFSIRSGSVHYSAKYIDTEAKREEYDERRDEWKFVYRGPFSVLKGGLRFGNAKVMKNTANTSVVKWGNKLLCFWEGGEPHEVHPGSIDTLGLFSLTAGAHVKSADEPMASLKTLPARVQKHWTSMTAHEIARALHIHGVSLTAKLLEPILKGVYAMPEERALAHVKVDNKKERLIIITCRAEDLLLPISTFTVYEFDTKLELQEKKEFVLPQQLMIHDWSLTDNYYVLVANRVKLSPEGSVGALLGLSPMISSLTRDESLPYSYMYLLPRTSAAEQGRDWKVPLRIPQQVWLLHTANSYEEMDEQGRIRIVLDVTLCSYKWMSLHNMFGYRWQNRTLDHSFLNNTNPAESEAYRLTRIYVTVDSAVAQSSTDHQQDSTPHMIPEPLKASRLSQPAPPLSDHPWLLSLHNSLNSGNGPASRIGTPTPSIDITAQSNSSVATPPQGAVQMQYFRLDPLEPCDFPTINPRVAGHKHKYVYGAATSGHRSELRNFPFDSIVKFQGPAAGKTTSWWAGDRNFVGEPMFVPRVGSQMDPTSPGFVEDDGYIVVVQYAAEEKTCYLVILDARRIGKTDPVVARLRVPKAYAFPMGFHGCWDQSPEDI